MPASRTALISTSAVAAAVTSIALAGCSSAGSGSAGGGQRQGLRQGEIQPRARSRLLLGIRRPQQGLCRYLVLGTASSQGCQDVLGLPLEGRIMEQYETSSMLDKDYLRKRIRNIILHQAPITREIFGFRHYEYMYSPSQLAFLCQQITNTAEVPGSILEVGCAWGATTVFLNRHIDELGLDVDYYTVDTFEGFTNEDIRTEHERGRRYYYDTAFHGNSKAWFDRTMRRNQIARATSFRADAATFDYKKIAPFRFVLIDVDLHRPVLAALEAIYDLVSPGGTIVIDDCKQGGEWGGAYEAFIEFTKANGLDATITHGKLGLIFRRPGPGPGRR